MNKILYLRKITNFVILGLSLFLLFFAFNKIYADSSGTADLKVKDITVDDRDILDIYNGNDGVMDVPSDTRGHTYIYFDDMANPKWTYSWTTLANKDFLKAGGNSHLRPQVIVGTHKIKVCIDPNDIVDESNESNNCLEKTVTSDDTVEIKADLTVSGVGMDYEMQAFYATICSLNKESRTIKVEYSANNYKNSLTLDHLTVNGCYKAYNKETFPFNLEEGKSYTLLVTADPDSLIDEENENNNLDSATITIPTAEIKADLTVTDAGMDYEMQAFYATVCSLNVKSDNIKVNYTANNYTNYLTLNLIANGCYKAYDKETYPFNLQKGVNYTLAVVVDPDGTISESNEENNIDSATINIPQEQVEPKIDFYIDAIGIETASSDNFYIDICSDNDSTQDAALLIAGQSTNNGVTKNFTNTFGGIDIVKDDCTRIESSDFDAINVNEGDVYTITATADPDLAIAEEIESNNSKTVTVTIPIQEGDDDMIKPNLSISNFDIDDDYTIYADICSMDKASSNVKVKFANVTEGGNGYYNFITLNTISADSCVRAYSSDAGFDFESEVTYDVLIAVDPDNVISETNENDNNASGQITFPPENQKIDLHVGDMGISEYGDSFYVYICSDNASTSNGELLIEGETPYKSFTNNFWGINIAAGECTKIYGATFDTINVDSGDTYTITATADPSDILDEEAEYNNVATEVITVP